MPHSVSPEASSAAEDSILPDASAEPLLEQGEDVSDTEADAIIESSGREVVESASHVRTDEVKLEDLFNDDEDEDEEFPSSGATDVKMASSPPQEPMYVSQLRLSIHRAANVDQYIDPLRRQQSTQTPRSCMPFTNDSFPFDTFSNG